jgi:hypothetical protein
MPDKLRFAVLCSGNSLSKTGIRMIERLMAQPGMACAAVLDIGQEPSLPGGWAWSPYRKWHAAQQRLSIEERFPQLPKIACPAGPELASRLAGLNLDFVLQTGLFPLEGLDGAAHFGVWRLTYGEGLPPAFAELDRGDLVITVSLERLGSPRQILRQGVVNVVPRSYGQTLDYAVTAGIDLPALVARQILRDGTLPEAGTRTLADKAAPTALRVARLFAGMAAAWARYQVSMTIRSEMWNVGVVHAPIANFLDGRYPSQIEWLPSLGSRRFVADPFAVESAQEFQLLLEEFDFDRYQGYITSAQWRPGSGLTGYRTVIDEGVHMSYPFPLLHEGRRYCIPESHQRREVAIYRIDEGAARWVQEAVLIRDFAALDATVIEHGGRWWMFCTCQDDLPECKLYLWHAPDLFGPWEPHALSPVKCDVRSSRPGGTPFVRNGELYRPTQDSSAGYGSALSINRVVRLTVDEFEEETVAHIKPPPGAFYRDGIHTLSAVGERTVLDGKRMTPVAGLAARRLLYKLKRLVRMA